jgi:hypothetical protein
MQNVLQQGQNITYTYKRLNYKITDNFLTSISLCIGQTSYNTERYSVSYFLTSPILMKL